MIDTQGPVFEVGEDAVHPGQHDMGGDLADDMGIVADAGSTRVGGPPVGLGGSAGGEIASEMKRVQAVGRIVGAPAETDAAGSGPAVLHLDGADDQHFPLMAASAAAGERVMLAAAGGLRLVDLDQTGEQAAAGGQHAGAQLGAQQPSALVRTSTSWHCCRLQRQEFVGMGRHQIGRPEPSGQRQLGVMHDGAGGDRGPCTAAGAWPGPRLGLQLPRLGLAAAGADKALGPAERGGGVAETQ